MKICMRRIFKTDEHDVVRLCILSGFLRPHVSIAFLLFLIRRYLPPAPNICHFL
jgi:hypothetical protein